MIAVQEAGIDAAVQMGILKEVSSRLAQAKAALEKLREVENTAASMPGGKEQAFFYKDEVKAAMDALRRPVDELEMLVDKEIWPYPTYADLMFEV